jgi:membrane protease YdiL (CAAX protease family)
MPPKIIAASTFEFGLVALGWILIWRLQFSAAARKKTENNPARLPRWNVDGAGFAFAVLCVCLGWLAASVAYGQLLQHFPSIKSDEGLLAILSGALSQLGLFSGVAAGIYYVRQTTTRTPAHETPSPAVSAKPDIVRAALVTFVITVAVVIPVQLLWKYFLERCHLPTTNQEMVEIFYRSASPPRVAALAAIAVLLAPVVEELVFRGGLFRFLRGRSPHWVALVLPALVFASLHVNYKTLEGLITLAPLTAFGIIFSLAYERTGRIAVVMIAHALFNLHTVVFLVLGLGN